ncbi:MAG: hypothetical protein JXR51_16170 [Bacteroidales bacterium]|nr:hypothetical protein [Bacteroidales bacterium]MBN2758704.1 hypothetical protein [Bacteroidales bacterium]
MKIFLKISILFIFIFISQNIYSNIYNPFHEFYFSICEINYNEKSKSLELSFRFFTDDIEKAVYNYKGGNIFTKNYIKSKESDKLIFDYILSKFSISVEKNEINYDFLGWETKESVIWCYIEVKNINLIHKIFVKNKLLTEIYPNQKNLTTLITKQAKRSVIFDKKTNNANLYTK